ncbi:uncharacterized protein LOC101861209 [Aplysia californica]|uniref:Uncharacterized protein LOC101861209 n=1 Tax=Aplysia californica TaxID=6500 RepID=A0ABM0JQI5_APLCA|nr:uncharacterized protein LOC101861209 [Aplysia californica]
MSEQRYSLLFICMWILSAFAGLSNGGTLQQCSEEMAQEAEIILSNSDMCAPLENFLVCCLRVLYEEDRLTPGAVQAVKENIDGSLLSLGINCTFDIDQLVKNVRDGTAITKKPVVPEDSGNSDKHGDGGTQMCIKNYMDNLKALFSIQEACGPMKTFMLCVLRALDVQFHEMPEEKKRKLQADLDTQMMGLGVTCSFTIDSLAEELRNKDSGVSGRTDKSGETGGSKRTDWFKETGVSDKSDESSGTRGSSSNSGYDKATESSTSTRTSESSATGTTSTTAGTGETDGPRRNVATAIASFGFPMWALTILALMLSKDILF